MLGLLGAVVAEGQTGISWVDAGKVLNEQPSYLGFDINVPVTTLVWIEVLAMGFAEIKRSAGACPNRRYRPAPPPGSPVTTRFFTKVVASKLYYISTMDARPDPTHRADPRASSPVSQSSTPTSAATPAATSIPSASPPRRRPPRLSSSSRPPSSSTAAWR